MDRRTFIQAGVTAGFAASSFGVSSCISHSQKASVPERLAALDMNTIFQAMDLQAARIDEFQFVEGHEDSIVDDVGKRAIKVLGQSTLFRELPLEAQLHPKMQERMWASVDDMENAVFGQKTYLAYNEFLQDPRLSHEIKSSSDSALRFLEKFDTHAGTAGASRRTRLRLRSIGIDAIAGMRRGSPQSALDEALEKARQMERTVALAGSVEEANRRATIRRLGRPALEAWENEIYEITANWQRIGGIYTASNHTSASVSSSMSSSPSEAVSGAPNSGLQHQLTPEEAYRIGVERGKNEALRAMSKRNELEQRIEAGRGLQKAGGWIMGIAATTVVVGGFSALVDPMITAVVSGTIGGILLITGIIILAVGSAIRKRAQRQLS